MTIQDFKKEYFNKIDTLDLDLIVAHTIQKSREFVLSHPEFEISQEKEKEITKNIKRRTKEEPLAYILGHKEFFGLDFLVNKHTLIPRPETELIIENILERKITKKTLIVDIGTGSGNIIISLAKNIQNNNTAFIASDTSKKALSIAKENSKKHNVNQKISFFKGSLLKPIVNLNFSRYSEIIIIANLPYLSKEIYASTKKTVKKFEPKSALYSPKQGLRHYEKLLNQLEGIKKDNALLTLNVFLEISPEQKTILSKIIENNFSKTQIRFHKDLSQKWRLCEIKL